jgi:hypothetical protein
VLWLLSILTVGAFLVSEKLIPYEPTWLLLLQAERMNNTRTPAIVSELIARSDKNELNTAAKARLAQRALRVQADPSLSWEREWAALLTDPNFAATLTPQERNAAVTAGALPEFLYRHRIREGQKLPVEIKLSISERFLQPGRSAKGRGYHIIIRDPSGRAVADVDQPEFIGLGTAMHGWSSMGVGAPLSLPPGEYRVEAACELMLPDPAGGPSAPLAVRAKGDLTVVARDTPTVGLVHDEEGGRLFAQVISFNGYLRHDGKAPFLSTPEGQDPTKAPALVKWAQAHRAVYGFDCFVQPLDKSLPEVQARAPSAIRCNDNGLVLGGPVFSVGPEYGPGRYRLRLVPSLAAAEESMADENIYGDEIIREIEVRAEQATMGTPAPKK